MNTQHVAIKVGERRLVGRLMLQTDDINSVTVIVQSPDGKETSFYSLEGAGGKDAEITFPEEDAVIRVASLLRNRFKLESELAYDTAVDVLMAIVER